MLLFFSLTFFTQEATENKITINRSVDAYFRTNLTDPNQVIEDEDGSHFLNPDTSFTNHSGFSLGIANVIFKHKGKKVGFVANLVFGPRGEVAVFLSTSSSNIVNQLYAYWNVSDKVRLTLGNFNYNTSYMFSKNLVLGLRGEYFGFHNQDFDDDTVFATTLSANYKIDDLIIIPEVRLDSWSSEFYIDNDFMPTKNLASFLMAAVY